MWVSRMVVLVVLGILRIGMLMILGQIRIGLWHLGLAKQGRRGYCFIVDVFYVFIFLDLIDQGMQRIIFSTK